ncbi:MAG: RNase adapter RapZ [Candidatus Marsarchaeota archaeon]|nr:RNase adapter RapZ [Candidatus Marsarchaeota archaeon]
MSEFVIVAGMSGAGRSNAAAVFEDLNWFVIDNMPPALISKVTELVNRPGSETERVVLVIGRGGSDYIAELEPELEALISSGARVRVLFLDSSDEVLIQRYEGTRRRHPLGGDGLSEDIRREREMLASLKDQADIVIDTSDLNVHELRDKIVSLFESAELDPVMRISVVSFGYKYGIPRDVDLIFDVRFVPNPHWIPELRPHTGLDKAVRDYVLAQSESIEFLSKLDDLFEFLLPAFEREGKSYLNVAIGCTGGKHRSVVIAEELLRIFRKRGFDPRVSHRDISR